MMKLMLKLLLICLFSSLVISATFDCKGKQDNTFYKDPENPHIFFECVGGRAVNFTCPENLVFDETLKSCDFIHPPNGTTTAHTIAPLTTVSTTQKATTAAPTTKATTAAPTTKATTAAPTTKATTAAPTTQATTAAPTTKATTAVPTTQATTAAPTTKATTAAPTTQATTAAPTTKVTTAAPTTQATTAAPTTKATTAASATTAGSTKPATTQKATTADPFADECKGKADGLHKDSKDAHKYFSCSGGRAFHMTCPENLFFNETAQSCDFSTTSDPKLTTAAATKTTAKP